MSDETGDGDGPETGAGGGEDAAPDPEQGKEVRDADAPRATAADCPACRQETVHDVLKARGRERTVRCRTCGRTHHVVAPRQVAVPVHVSRGDETTRDVLETTEDAVLAVGDRLFVAGAVAEVTAVEDADGRRPDRLAAADVHALWAKDVEQEPTRITVHEGPRSRAFETMLGPEEQVTVGGVLTVGGRPVRVDRVKVDGGMVRQRGRSVQAADVVRVYGYWDDREPPGGRGGGRGQQRDRSGGQRAGGQGRGRRRR